MRGLRGGRREGSPGHSMLLRTASLPCAVHALAIVYLYALLLPELCDVQVCLCVCVAAVHVRSMGGWGGGVYVPCMACMARRMHARMHPPAWGLHVKSAVCRPGYVDAVCGGQLPHHVLVE